MELQLHIKTSFDLNDVLMIYIFFEIYLDAQFFAVFEAASLEYQAPCPTAHTSTKTVHASTTASFRLVSSFWHIILLRLPVAQRRTYWRNSSGSHSRYVTIPFIYDPLCFTLTALPLSNLV